MFKEISPVELNENAFNLFNKDWALLTAGDLSACNTMTISWGGVGILWNKPVATVYVRPVRYTYEFIEKSETFTLSFFDEQYRKALNLCGSKSGRDINKIADSGLTPYAVDNTTCFEQARLVLVCRKIYYSDIKPEQFLDSTIEKNYPQKDYHRMYIGKIEKVLIK